MNLFAIMGLVNSIATFLIGSFIYFEDRKNALHKGFMFFVFPISLWSFFYSLWLFQSNGEVAFNLIRIGMIPCYFIPAGFLWFVKVFTTNKAVQKYRIWYFVIPLFFACFTFTDFMMPGFKKALFFDYWPQPGPLMYVCTAVYQLTVAYAFVLLFQKWAGAKGAEKRNVRLVTITTLLCWLGGSTNWLLWYDIPIPPYSNFLVALFLSILAYSVLQKGIFDIHDLAKIVREEKLTAIGTMATCINHEIRNPLYVANGLAATCLEKLADARYDNYENLKSEVEDSMTKIVSQTNRAMDIIKRFSVFAKQSLDQEFRAEQIDIRDIFKTVKPLVEHELESKNIVLKEEIESDLLSIQADPRHLEEILFNLIVNAAQAIASEEQLGEIVVKAYSENESVVIEVRDNGPGITAEELDRVFEPFHTSKAEGTGLGLYITKQLVEKNGGKIRVSSKVKHFTAFRMTFNQ